VFLAPLVLLLLAAALLTLNVLVGLTAVLAGFVLWRVATLIGRSKPRDFLPEAPPPGLLPELRT
jgi:hypothetical protein